MRDDNNHLSKLDCLKARCQGCGCDESANGEIMARLKRSPRGSKVHEIMAIYRSMSIVHVNYELCASIDN